MSETIADANTLLASGKIPLGVPAFSPFGVNMLIDALILDDFTDGRLTRVCRLP